jgi:hypothetical protein
MSPVSARRSAWKLLTGLPYIARLTARAAAQSPQAAPPPSPAGGPGMQMLTIFLRHDQAQTLEQSNGISKPKAGSRIFPLRELRWFHGM